MKDITFEEMFEWLEEQRSKQNSSGKGNKIIDALENEIGYHIDEDGMIVDDFDTKQQDYYER